MPQQGAAGPPRADDTTGTPRELSGRSGGRARWPRSGTTRGRAVPALGDERARHGEVDEQGDQVGQRGLERAPRLDELLRRVRSLRGGDTPGGHDLIGGGGERVQSGAQGGAIVRALDRIQGGSLWSCTSPPMGHGAPPRGCTPYISHPFYRRRGPLWRAMVDVRLGHERSLCRPFSRAWRGPVSAAPHTAHGARRNTPTSACALQARPPPPRRATVRDDPRLSRRVWDTRERRLRRRRRTGRAGVPCRDERGRGDGQA